MTRFNNRRYVINQHHLDKVVLHQSDLIKVNMNFRPLYSYLHVGNMINTFKKDTSGFFIFYFSLIKQSNSKQWRSKGGGG